MHYHSPTRGVKEVVQSVVSFHYMFEDEAVQDEELGELTDLFCPDHPFDPRIAE